MNEIHILKIISGTYDDKWINTLCVSSDKDKLIERQSTYQMEIEDIIANKPPWSSDEYYEWISEQWQDISYGDLSDNFKFFITEIENI